MLAQSTDRLRALYYSNALLWGIGLIGCALRLHWYVFNRSLSWPEAALALNLMHKPWPALLGQLDNNQAAPIGFMLGVRALTSALGDSEFVLRLLPLVSGIATLPLFFKVARWYARPSVVPLALGFVAFSPPQLYYSSECKPYMCDLTLALIVLLGAAWMAERSVTVQRALGLTLVGAAAVWCSYPIALVLAGVVAVSLLACLSSRDWGRLGALAAIGACWLASFSTYYVVSLRTVSANMALQRFWSSHFLFLQNPRASYAVIADVFSSTMYPATGHGSLVVALFVIGSFSLWFRSRLRCALLMGPLAFAAFAAFFGAYPVASRLFLFSLPLWLLPTLEGIARLAAWSSRISTVGGVVVVGALTGLLGIRPLISAVSGPAEVQDVRPLVAYISAHARPEDTLYVSEFAPVYEYYRWRFNLADRPYMTGMYIDGPWWEPKDLKILDSLRGKSRVWVLTDIPEISWSLDSIGRRREQITKTGVTLYLYDLTARPS